MAITNISLTPFGWAYTNSWKPTTNYAYSNPLELCGSSTSLHGESKVILQFNIPSNMSGSKINTAILNFDMQALWDSSQIVTTDWTIKLPIYYSSAITNGYVFDSVTHSNYTSLITQGVRNRSDDVKSGEKHYYSNQVDITSIVANNINNNILTIILEGLTGVQSQQINPNSISLLFNFEEVDPVTPLVVSPNGTYENRQNEIRFDWIYKSQTEAKQASATLEYRTGTSGSYTAINIYSSNNYYIMPANTLSSGICEWRVKTTDTDGKISEYAYAAFTVIDRPSVPIITDIENKCIAAIFWSSSDQISFEIEIYNENELKYSKKVSSAANNYKPNMFFANTTYTIKLRVCNIYGLWSEWGSKIFTFTFVNPVKPSILVAAINHEVIIKSNIIGAMVYKSENNRNFIPIGKTNEDYKFIDFSVASDKTYKYFVRNYEDGFTDSEIQSAQITLKGAILQNSIGYVKLILSTSPFSNYNKSIKTEKTINKYSGRKFGVVEFGEYIEKSITLSVACDTNDISKLDELYLSNQPLTYRDFRGNKFLCVIDSKSEYQLSKKYYTFDLTIYQVDEKEEINVYE